jgi:hypothetical protein
MTGGGEGQLLRERWADAVKGNGETSTGEVGLYFGEDAGAKVNSRRVLS